MKKLTIFDVYVKMTSQAQCDRMKRVCVVYELPYWKNYSAFKFEEKKENEFSYAGNDEFYIGINLEQVLNKTEVTEEQFMELLKEYKNNFK